MTTAAPLQYTMVSNHMPVQFQLSPRDERRMNFPSGELKASFGLTGELRYEARINEIRAELALSINNKHARKDILIKLPTYANVIGVTAFEDEYYDYIGNRYGMRLPNVLFTRTLLRTIGEVWENFEDEGDEEVYECQTYNDGDYDYVVWVRVAHVIERIITSGRPCCKWCRCAIHHARHNVMIETFDYMQQLYIDWHNE